MLIPTLAPGGWFALEREILRAKYREMAVKRQARPKPPGASRRQLGAAENGLLAELTRETLPSSRGLTR
jgi:hypothetical protein